MIFAPNSKSERTLALLVKACSCLLLLAVALGFSYFAFEDLEERFKGSAAATTFSVLFMLAFSGFMFIALYGAAKTSIEDFAIEIRILRSHGFRKIKHMAPEEFQRLAALERSIDEEIRERVKARRKLR
jgi:hypothetical protein